MQREERFYHDLFDKLIFFTVKADCKDILVMYDTGATISVISESLAASLHCRAKNSRLAVGNSAGHLFTMESALLDRIELCGLTVENVEVGVVPDQYFDFGVDENGKVFPAQMFLGWNIISQFYWRIDIKNQFYVVSQYANKKADNLQYDNFPTIKLKYRSEDVWLGIDTGHTETLLDKTWFSRLHDLHPVKDEFRGMGSSSVERSFVAENLELAFENEKFCLKKAKVLRHSVNGLNSSAVGLLGIDFFENARFEMDYRNKFFHIQKI